MPPLWVCSWSWLRAGLRCAPGTAHPYGWRCDLPRPCSLHRCVLSLSPTCSTTALHRTCSTGRPILGLRGSDVIPRGDRHSCAKPHQVCCMHAWESAQGARAWQFPAASQNELLGSCQGHHASTGYSTVAEKHCPHTVPAPLKRPRRCVSACWPAIHSLSIPHRRQPYRPGHPHRRLGTGGPADQSAP